MGKNARPTERRPDSKCSIGLGIWLVICQTSARTYFANPFLCKIGQISATHGIGLFASVLRTHPIIDEGLSRRRPMWRSTKILFRPADRIFKGNRGVNRPVRIAEHFPRQQYQVSFSARDNGL